MDTAQYTDTSPNSVNSYFCRLLLLALGMAASRNSGNFWCCCSYGLAGWLFGEKAEWMAELGNRTSVAVSYVGKVKTTLQMVAIAVLLAVDPVLHPVWDQVGIVLLYIAAILTLWSMVIYLRAAWPELSRVPNQEDSSEDIGKGDD